MFSHVMVGSNDIARSKTFYDALFTALGGKPGRQDDKGGLFYVHKGSAFLVGRPIDGDPACHANGGTIGFSADGPEQVESWHQAGVAARRHPHRRPARPPPGPFWAAPPGLSARPGWE
jgi:catechol 2,3-dioxygenase-like lactoylglutathione lyase family enzyme